MPSSTLAFVDPAFGYRNGTGGLQGVGNVARLDLGFVVALVGEPLRVGRPPIALGAIHLFLGDKFGHAVGHGRRGALGHGLYRAGGELDHLELAVAHGGDGGAIRGETGIDPVGAGEGDDRQVGPVHDVKATGEGDQETLSVLGKVELGEALQRDAGALAAGLFFRAQFLLGIAQQLGGGQQLALPAGGDIELVETQDRVAWSAAEEKDRAAVMG